MNEGVYREPSFESGEREGSSDESNAAALVPARTEAGRHDISNEELQPLKENPPPRKKPVRKIREDQLDLAKGQRDARTGYALRHRPKKARSKDL
jgi:hypothetical protein